MKSNPLCLMTPTPLCSCVLAVRSRVGRSRTWRQRCNWLKTTLCWASCRGRCWSWRLPERLPKSQVRTRGRHGVMRLLPLVAMLALFQPLRNNFLCERHTVIRKCLKESTTFFLLPFSRPSAAQDAQAPLADLKLETQNDSGVCDSGVELSTL